MFQNRKHWPAPAQYGALDLTRGLGLGGGDYVRFEVCIDCKVVISLASAEEILAIEEGMSDEQESD